MDVHEEMKDSARFLLDFIAQRPELFRASQEAIWREAAKNYGVDLDRKVTWREWLHYRTIGRFRAWLHRDCR